MKANEIRAKRRVVGCRLTPELITRIQAVGLKKVWSNRIVVETCVINYLPVLEKECGIIPQGAAPVVAPFNSKAEARALRRASKLATQSKLVRVE